MLGNLFRSISAANVTSEVNVLLVRNYNLSPLPQSLQRYVTSWIEYRTKNPHEMAVAYAAEQVAMMKKDDPTDISNAKKYLRVAKQAYSVGAAVDDWAIKELVANAKALGIDASQIRASPN